MPLPPPSIPLTIISFYFVFQMAVHGLYLYVGCVMFGYMLNELISNN